MVAVAVRADGRVDDPMGDGLPVDTCAVCSRNFAVAGSTGLRHIPMVDRRTGVALGEDRVSRVAIRARCGILIAPGQRAAVNAGLIAFHRMREPNLMLREEARIGVAGATDPWQVLLRNRR